MSAQLLQCCRQRFGTAPRTFPANEQNYLKLKPPSWCWLRMDPLMEFYKNQEQIRDCGQVVWGHLVQANNLLYEPGNDDCPASVVYSLDPWFDDHFEQLEQIAGRLYELKGQQPTDPLVARVAHYLAAETERQVSLPVPRHWADGRELFVGDVIVHRKHLPSGYLTEGFLPLVVLPGRGMMIVPSRYWGESLVAEWVGEDPQPEDVELYEAYEAPPGNASWLAKVLLAVAGAVVLMLLLCGGLVGGLVFAFRMQQQPANPPWQGPAVQPPVARPFPPAPGGMRPEFERIQQDQSRRQQEMQQRLDERLRRHQEIMEEHRRKLNP